MPTSRARRSGKRSCVPRRRIRSAPGRARPPTSTSRWTDRSTGTPRGTTPPPRTPPGRSLGGSLAGRASRSGRRGRSAGGAGAGELAGRRGGLVVELPRDRVLERVVGGLGGGAQRCTDLVPAGPAPQGRPDADQLAVVGLAGDDLPEGQQLQRLVGVQRGVHRLERAPVVRVRVLNRVEGGLPAVATAEEVQAGGGRGQRELRFQGLGSDAHARRLPRLRPGAKLPRRVTVVTHVLCAGRYVTATETTHALEFRRTRTRARARGDSPGAGPSVRAAVRQL